MVYEASNSVAMIDNRSLWESTGEPKYVILAVYQLDKMEDVYLVSIFLNS